MQGDGRTGKVEDGMGLYQATSEMIMSPLTPTYDTNFTSLANGQSHPTQYITPGALNSTNLDPAVYDRFSDPTSASQTQSFGSSSADYTFATTPDQDWAGPSYFPEATSSAPFTASGPLSGHGSVSPRGLAGEFTNPFDCVLFPLIPNRVDSTSSAPVSMPESSSLPAKDVYTSHLLGNRADAPSYLTGRSTESQYGRGSGHIQQSQVASSSPGMFRTGNAALELEDGGTEDGGTGNKVQLRTAFRKAKTNRRPSRSSVGSGKKTGQEDEAEDEDPLTPEERRARQSHNIVEKQYRNRLNAQFVRLLAVLPAEQRSGSPGDDSAISDPPGEEKRVSKAEVLDLATKRIKELEEERSRLEEANKELMGNVDAMTSAVVTRGPGKLE